MRIEPRYPPLVEELRKDPGGGLIGKVRLVQLLKHGLALGGAEPPGLCLRIAGGVSAWG